MLAATGLALLTALGTGVLDADNLIRASSARFVAVHVISLAAAIRLLSGRTRVAAVAVAAERAA